MSHHSAHTLTQIKDPYLAIEEATTYELSACYNVSIDCHAGDMVANIHTTTMFKGKVYAKGSPVTCVADVEDKQDFSIQVRNFVFHRDGELWPMGLVGQCKDSLGNNLFECCLCLEGQHF